MCLNWINVNPAPVLPRGYQRSLNRRGSLVEARCILQKEAVLNCATVELPFYRCGGFIIAWHSRAFCVAFVGLGSFEGRRHMRGTLQRNKTAPSKTHQTGIDSCRRRRRRTWWLRFFVDFLCPPLQTPFDAAHFVVEAAKKAPTTKDWGTFGRFVYDLCRWLLAGTRDACVRASLSKNVPFCCLKSDVQPLRRIGCICTGKLLFHKIELFAFLRADIFLHKRMEFEVHFFKNHDCGQNKQQPPEIGLDPSSSYFNRTLFAQNSVSGFWRSCHLMKLPRAFKEHNVND